MNVAARRTATSLALVAAALLLMIWGCWAAVSDAQGAIAFLVLGPLSIALAIGALLLAREGRRLGGRGVAVGAGLFACLLLAFQSVFFGCAFVPACRPVPQAIIAAVSSAYTLVSGETPYATAHRR